MLFILINLYPASLTYRENELFETRRGIRSIVPEIVTEVIGLKQQHSDLQKIRIAGNSLGGLFARYLAEHLFDHETKHYRWFRTSILVGKHLS